MNKMKRIYFFFAIIVTLVIGCKGDKTKSNNSGKSDSVSLLVTQIQRCSRLYTAEAQVRKIITSEDSKHYKGTFLNKKIDISLPFSSRKIAIPVDATVKAYIDFSDFSEKNVVKNGDKIEILLPDPHIMLSSTHIDHEGVRKNVAFMRSNYTDSEITAINQLARQKIINEMPKIGIIDMAQMSAANVIIPIIKLTGYKQENIKITFRKDFDGNEIKSFLDNSSIEEQNEEK